MIVLAFIHVLVTVAIWAWVIDGEKQRRYAKRGNVYNARQVSTHLH